MGNIETPEVAPVAGKGLLPVWVRPPMAGDLITELVEPVYDYVVFYPHIVQAPVCQVVARFVRALRPTGRTLPAADGLLWTEYA